MPKKFRNVRSNKESLLRSRAALSKPVFEQSFTCEEKKSGLPFGFKSKSTK